MSHDTPYARWMKRHSLSHRQASTILGVSESTSQQYVTGVNRTTGKPQEVPPPVRKLMVAYDQGVVFELRQDQYGIADSGTKKSRELQNTG